MSKLDIRTAPSNPTVIVFGDHTTAYATQINIEGTYIILQDSEGDYENDVSVGDVDNLILALQKAKEVMGSR